MVVRLPRAVRPQEAADRVLLHLQVQRLEGLHALVALAQAVRLDHILGHVVECIHGPSPISVLNTAYNLNQKCPGRIGRLGHFTWIGLQAYFPSPSSLSESRHFATGRVVIHWSHDQKIQDC